jgi:hypothetical protein
LSFGLTAKPRPNDNRVMVLFILGGITFNEIREVKELIAKQNLYELIIVSNCIASPSQIYEKVFSQFSSSTIENE